MQHLALRKAASSKLMLLATILMLLILITMPVMVWFLLDSSLSSIPIRYDLLPYLKITVMIVLVPALGVAVLPVIAMFMIYANARSDRPLKTTGYTILRGYMIAMIAVSALLLIFSIPTRFFSFRTVSTFFSMLIQLLLSIGAVSALKTAKDVVLYGVTYRQFPAYLPVLLILSLCISAATLIVSVLANTVPALTTVLTEYRIESAAAYYVRVSYAALGLVASLLDILLCFRGKKALTRKPEEIPYEQNY